MINKKNFLKKFFIFIGLLLFTFGLSSCTSSQVYVYPSKKFLSYSFFKKESKKLKDLIEKHPEILSLDKGKKSIDWYENSGSIFYFAKNYNLSYDLFKFADTKINFYEQKLLSEKIIENIKSLLINDYLNGYIPPIYERVFVNIYMAQNSLLMGDFTKFNINLNRAIERLKYAHLIFEKELEENKPTFNSAIKITKKSILPIEKAYTNLDLYKPYQNFENPYVYFLKGIYYLYSNEPENAMDMFKITYGLIKDKEPATKIVSKAWELAKNNKKEKYVWIIYLNGLSLKKVERKFEIPIEISNKFILISISLPYLIKRPLGPKHLKIYVENFTVRKEFKTYRLVNVNNLIAFEFKKKLKSLILKEISRNALKALIQVEAEKHFGVLGGIAAITYTKITSHADTRQWLWLPAEIQVALVKVPKKGNIIVYANNKKVLSLSSQNIKTSKIILVRSFNPQSDILIFSKNLK